MTTDLDRLHAWYEADKSARQFTKSIQARLIESTGPVISNILDVTQHHKAAVDLMSTGNQSALQSSARAFVNLMARFTVLGRLTGIVPAPPKTPIPTPTTEPTPQWVMEGNPIPLGKIDFDAPRTAISKYALIVAFAQELVRMADERWLSLIERVTLRALRHGEDALLLSDTAAVAQGNPAGLLFGLVATGGGSPTTLAADFESLWTAVSDGDPDFPAFVVSPRGAMYLATLNEDGTPLFPNVSPATGGNIYGVPVLLAKAAGAKVVLIDGGRIAVTDESLEIAPSRESAVEMVDTPTPGATTLTSAFQTNTALLRFIRYIHWTKLTDDAVAFLELPINGLPA